MKLSIDRKTLQYSRIETALLRDSALLEWMKKEHFATLHLWKKWLGCYFVVFVSYDTEFCGAIWSAPICPVSSVALLRYWPGDQVPSGDHVRCVTGRQQGTLAKWTCTNRPQLIVCLGILELQNQDNSSLNKLNFLTNKVKQYVWTFNYITNGVMQATWRKWHMKLLAFYRVVIF